MKMHTEFDLTRSAADVKILFALRVGYSATRKHRGDLLRLAVMSLNRVLN